MVQQRIFRNAGGMRIGQSHPLAKLMDDEVDLVHALLEAGLSLAKVAEKMEVSKSCVAHISSGRRRGQAVASIDGQRQKGVKP